MISSVGAEKDPYLQAYIQARMKNHVEEIKLQKVLANLEVGRKIKKIMINMELYEDRKVAHKLQQEASDVEAKNKKAMRKYISKSQTDAFASLTSKRNIYAFQKVTRSATVTMTELTPNVETTPTYSKRKTSIFPVTVGKNRTLSPNNVHIISREAAQDDTSPHHGHEAPTSAKHIILTVDNANQQISPRSRSQSFQQRENIISTENSTPCYVSRAGSTRKKSESNNLANARRRSSAVPQLPPPTVHIEVVDVDRMKTAATIPMRRRKQRATDARSVQTLPNLSTTDFYQSELKSRPKTSSLWPGDPNAIRSVRRERKRPEEMLSSVKNGEEARRMIRETPATCSKNCMKPDILQELGRSYSDLPSLLPAIEKARHEFARKEAADRDIPIDDMVEKDLLPMPVSEIQYSALRSLGGVRRNSVMN